jgi:hypothetical protein
VRDRAFDDPHLLLLLETLHVSLLARRDSYHAHTDRTVEIAEAVRVRLAGVLNADA